MIYTNYNQLKQYVSLERGQGKRIVTTNGVFDLLHPGHLNFIHEASLQGDVLVVGVNCDATVTKRKGVGRPVLPVKYRAQMVAALRWVSAVFIFSEDDPRHLIEAVKPDVHVTSAEYLPCAAEDATARAVGAKVVYLKRRIDLPSTSKIIEQLCNLPSQGSQSRKPE